MLLREEDQEVFKRWVIPKLETISDADNEVLADYVIALVTNTENDANFRRKCLDSLSDFLHGNTAAFVDELIATLEANSYTSHAPASGHATDGASVKLEQHTQPVPIESIVGTSTSEYLPYPLHASNKPPANAPRGPAATRVPAAQHRLPDRPTRVSPSPYLHQDNGHTSRKRKLKERDTSQPREGHDTHSNRASGGERPAKQTARRGGKTGRDGGMMIQNGAPGFGAPSNAPFAFPPFPEGPPFPDVPPFDPTNPMAFLAMAAAFGVNVPGMPGSNTQGVDISNVSCPDYETKGYCATGSICPFQHGGAITVSADSLPKYSSLAEHSEAGNERSHGGSRVRAPFSNPGPTHDRTNTTLVVEQIPHDNFSEQDVRDFFSSFGTLVDVQMQAYKRLAIIKYDTHDAAKRAYNSPKAVFDNRFVKVYWHKSRSDVGPPRTGQSEYGMNEASYQDEEILDPEEVRKRQVEAQRSFDNRRKKDEEAAAKAGEIDRKLRETNAEVQRLKRELAAKSRHGSNGNLDEEFSQDLANLQAEAEDLFAQQDTHASQSGERGRGSYRGGYHGRGNTSFPSRGGYAPSLRGGYQGRDGYYNGSRTGVKRLDNRPRRIAVANIQPGSKRDEALRQHLINVPDCTSIEQHPRQPNSLIVTFQERYQAESFLDGANSIPDVGKLELTWVPNDAYGDMQSSKAEADAQASDEDSVAVKVEDTEADQTSGADVDMDVADDVDQWL